MSTVSLKDWERRKEFVRFGEADAETLRSLASLMEQHAERVLDELYEHFMRFSETRSFFTDDATLQRVKAMQAAYFLGLTGGDYGEKYLDNRLTIGRVHRQIGLEPRWYMGAYSVYMQLIFPTITAKFTDQPEKAAQAIASLLKVFTLDQDLAITAYISAFEEVVTRQADEILEISTPVVEVWEGVLVLPLIGTLDTRRAQQFMEQLLGGIVERRARIALVDVTAVPMVDTRTAHHFIEAISAVRLIGGELVLTGIRPAIAQTIVQLGVDTSAFVTRPSLAGGLAYALKQIGYELRQI